MQSLYSSLTAVIIFIGTLGGALGGMHWFVRGGLVTGRIDPTQVRFDSVREFYAAALNFVIETVERQFRFGGLVRVVSVVAAISITYTIMMFFLSWTLGGSGTTGSVQVLPSFQTDQQRFYFAVIFLALVVLTFVSVIYDSKIHTFIFSIFGRWPTKIILGSFGGVLVYLTWSFVVPSLPNQMHSMAAFVGLEPSTFLYIIFASAAMLVLVASMVSGNPLTILNFTVAACFGYAANLPLTIFFPLALVLAWPLSGPIPVLISVFLSPVLIGILALFLPLDVALIIGAFFPAYVAIILAATGSKTPARIFALLAIGLIELFPMGLGVYLRGFELGLSGAISIVFLWSVLPMVNIAFDFLSWAITWKLLKHLLEAFQTTADNTQKRIRVAASHLLVDMIIALILIPGVLIGVLFSVKLFNTILLSQTGAQPLDLMPLFRSGTENPFGPEAAWFTFMIFSTIIPTLVHFAIVISSLLFSFLPTKSLVSIPQHHAGKLDGIHLERAAYAATGVFVASILMMFVILIALGHLIALLGVVPSLVYELAILLGNTIGMS